MNGRHSLLTIKTCLCECEGWDSAAWPPRNILACMWGIVETMAGTSEERVFFFLLPGHGWPLYSRPPTLLHKPLCLLHSGLFTVSKRLIWPKYNSSFCTAIQEVTHFWLSRDPTQGRNKEKVYISWRTGPLYRYLSIRMGGNEHRMRLCMKWCNDLIRTPPGFVLLKVFWANPAGKRPQGGLRIGWRDSTVHLMWPGNILGFPRRTWGMWLNCAKKWWMD